MSLLEKVVSKDSLNGNEHRLVGAFLTRREISHVCREVEKQEHKGKSDQEIIETTINKYTDGRVSKGPDDPKFHSNRRSEQIAQLPLFSDPKRKASVLRVLGRSIFEPFVGAFILLTQLAEERSSSLYQVTVQFGPKFIARLKARKDGKQAAYFGRYLSTQHKLIKHCIVVIEQGNVAKPEETRGLHAHLIALLSCDQVEPLRRVLKKCGTGAKNAVQISSNYTVTSPYTESIQLEEEKFGELPSGAPSSHSYWQGMYRDMGKYRFFVRNIVPIDLGLADYMSKDLTGNEDRGKKFSLVGLAGHRAIREQFYKEGQELMIRYKSM